MQSIGNLACIKFSSYYFLFKGSKEIEYGLDKVKVLSDNVILLSSDLPCWLIDFDGSKISGKFSRIWIDPDGRLCSYISGGRYELRKDENGMYAPCFIDECSCEQL